MGLFSSSSKSENNPFTYSADNRQGATDGGVVFRSDFAGKGNKNAASNLHANNVGNTRYVDPGAVALAGDVVQTFERLIYSTFGIVGATTAAGQRNAAGIAAAGFEANRSESEKFTEQMLNLAGIAVVGVLAVMLFKQGN